MKDETHPLDGLIERDPDDEGDIIDYWVAKNELYKSQQPESVEEKYVLINTLQKRISDALALIDRLPSTPDLIRVKKVLTGQN